MQTATPSEVSERVRRVTVQVLKQRVELLGVDRSGAYEHYNLLLSRGFPLPGYDAAIPELIRGHLPGLRSYHVIGSGLGTLPLLLACDGFAAVGVERDEPRHLTATAILQALTREFPGPENNCRFIGAEFPAAVLDIDVSDSLAIVTDFVSTHSPGQFAALCQGLARYRYVLMDVQRFCSKRTTPDEWAALIGELSGYGLEVAPESIDLGSEGCYRLFESRSVAERMSMRGNRIDAPRDATVQADAREIAARARAPETPRAIPAADVAIAMLPPRPRRARRKRLGGLTGISALLVIGVPTFFAILYYGFVAANQYVTTFEFTVRGPDSDQQRKSYLGMSSGSAMTPDAFVVSDYINSAQAERDVRQYVDPRIVFSRPIADFGTRLDPSASDDRLDAFWKRMVSAQFDIISGNVLVTVRAFSATDSLDLANALITASNAMFVRLNDEAARDFVRLADNNLARTEKRLDDNRATMRAFRAKHGLLQPDKVVAANSTLADDLRRELAGLRTQYATVLASSPRSPTLDILKARITAVEAAIGRVVDAKSPELAPTVTPAELEEYESLGARAQNLEKLYSDAMDLQQKAYLAAASQQSYLALFIKPRLADSALYPHRLESVAIVFLAAAAVWFIGLMVAYAVRDHLI
jgi:capsular polysaccharide transport system permease protein